MKYTALSLLSLVLLLSLSSHVWSAPNDGKARSQSKGHHIWKQPKILAAPSDKFGTAPHKVSFDITIEGSSLGGIGNIWVVCNDDDGNVLDKTGIVTPAYTSDIRTVYTVEGQCEYKSATTSANWPVVYINFRGSLHTQVVDIYVSEPVGSIGVQLEVEPLISTETTDLTMTAEVTGEAGNNIDCRFWCDCASPGAEWAGGGACGAHDDVGDGPAVSPDIDVVFDHADHACANDVIPGDCAVPGECVAAVVCQRNAQEDTAYVPYTILADTIYGLSLTADPGHGDTGGGTLDNVDLEATFSTSCLASGTFDIEFDCENDAAADETYAAEDLADYVDEEGLITFSMRGDGGSVKCDGYPVGTTEAEVTVDCENATTATAVTDVVGENAPATTFFFSSSTVPPGGVESLNDVRVWVGAWDGTAIGDITIDAVDCDTGAADNEGVDYFSAGYNIGDLSSSYNLFQQGISCDYATDAVYEGDVDATRDGVSFTTTFYVTVTPQPNPPIFQLSETSFNRMALAGEDADDVVFTIGNIGGSNLEWDEDPVGAGESETWLSCTPDAAVMNATAGPANGESEEITCTITSSTLGIGSYSATVTYTDPAATPTSPDTPVTVSLTVTPISTPIHLEVDTNFGIGTVTAAGPSPLAVSFSTVDASFGTDYTSSTQHETSTIDPFADIYYEWDFGDAGCPQGELGDCRWDAISDGGAGDTNHGARSSNRLSRNYMTGPIGAHVYEPATFPYTCGVIDCEIYYPILRATDEDGNVAYWSGTVTVYDPDSESAGTTYGWGDANETACVNRVGDADFSGCPLASPPARHTNSDGKLQTIIAAEITAGARRILFKGGSSWVWDANYTLDNSDNKLIGSYGTGNATFTLNTASLYQPLFTIEGANYRIQDLNFAGTMFSGSYWIHNNDTLDNFLLQRITETSTAVGTLFNAGDTTSGGEAAANVGNFFIDNTHLASTSGYYVLYPAGADLHIIGNVFSSRTSHAVRVTAGKRVSVSNNLFAATTSSKSSIQLRDRPIQCDTTHPLSGIPNQHIVVQDNDVSCGANCIQLGLQGCGNGSPWNFEQKDHIFEKNYFYSNGSTARVLWGGDQMNGPTYGLAFRNNVIDADGMTGTAGLIDAGSWTGGSTRVNIHNNTIYRSTAGTTYGINTSAGNTETCYNNVVYAPGTHAWIMPTESCDTQATNLDNFTSDPFFNAAADARWGFWPKVGDTQLRNIGTDVPSIYDDAIASCRKVPFGGMDIGALESPVGVDDGAVAGVPGCR